VENGFLWSGDAIVNTPHNSPVSAYFLILIVNIIRPRRKSQQNSLDLLKFFTSFYDEFRPI